MSNKGSKRNILDKIFGQIWQIETSTIRADPSLALNVDSTDQHLRYKEKGADDQLNLV